jgi:hypothetical protein
MSSPTDRSGIRPEVNIIELDQVIHAEYDQGPYGVGLVVAQVGSDEPHRSPKHAHVEDPRPVFDSVCADATLAVVLDIVWDYLEARFIVVVDLPIVALEDLRVVDTVKLSWRRRIAASSSCMRDVQLRKAAVGPNVPVPSVESVSVVESLYCDMVVALCFVGF